MPFFNDNGYMDGTHIYVWILTETVNDLIDLCRRRGVDYEGLDNIKAETRRREILTERLMLQIIFGKPVALQHTVDGAPYIIEDDIHLSISHTFGSVCIATNRNHAVGIDIERRGTRVIRVRDKFLNELELNWIPEDDADSNLIAWTAKEALYKAVGESGIDFSDDLQLEPFKKSILGILTFKAHFARRSPMVDYVVKTKQMYDYILTWAYKD
jgi:4'-phosphopantetheinyl transferase